MRLSLNLAAAAILAASNVLAVPTPSDLSHVLHETRRRGLVDWEKVGRVDRDIILPVRIGLTQSNLDKGYQLLDEV